MKYSARKSLNCLVFPETAPNASCAGRPSSSSSSGAIIAGRRSIRSSPCARRAGRRQGGGSGRHLPPAYPRLSRAPSGLCGAPTGRPPWFQLPQLARPLGPGCRPRGTVVEGEPPPPPISAALPAPPWPPGSSVARVTVAIQSCHAFAFALGSAPRRATPHSPQHHLRSRGWRASG